MYLSSVNANLNGFHLYEDENNTTMRKMYIAPAVEINETMTTSMMALSLQSGAADDSEVLGKEENEWNVWGDDEE